MGWESSVVIGFDLGLLLQLQMRIAKLKVLISRLLLWPAGQEIIKCIPCVFACVSVCVTFLKRAVHHTGCFSLAFSMFYDLIAYVFSFDAVFSDLGP